MALESLMPGTENTVSMTFKDAETGEIVLQVVGKVSAEDKAELEKAGDSKAVVSYLLASVCHHLKLAKAGE